MSEVAKVYAAIAAVMADISVDGISKDRKNQQQGYNFRGIDDVYNALSPILAKHQLCVLPRILSREVTERQTKQGGALFSVTVEAEFDVVCAEDGSRHTVRTFGEAMDSADKATNKAMSAAYKYAAMQAFCIPTEGDNDSDFKTYEVAPGTSAPPPQKPMLQRERKALWGELADELRACETPDQLRMLWASAKFQAEVKKLKPDDVPHLEAVKDELKADFDTRNGKPIRPPNFDGLDTGPSDLPEHISEAARNMRAG